MLQHRVHGFDASLAKPYGLAELRQALGRALGQAAPAPQPRLRA
jgi:hypothetical protein